MCSETLHFEYPIRYGVKRSICERTITNSNWSEMLHMYSCCYYFKSAAVSHDGGILSAYRLWDCSSGFNPFVCADVWHKMYRGC